MDILYIIGKDCSKCDNFELRASLRSIEKYGKNVGKVYVVGYCPDWLSDEVVKIPCEDLNQDEELTMTQKAQNICTKVLYAVDNSDIGEEFLVSMDDHFYTRDTDFDNYPYFANISVKRGVLPQEPQTREYQQFLYECGEYLKSKGLPTFYITMHRNMHMTRSAITVCREMIDECMKDGIACELFCLVGNYLIANEGVSPIFVPDIKIAGGKDWWKTSNERTEVFSTADFNKGSGLCVLLSGMFNQISKYEKYE